MTSSCWARRTRRHLLPGGASAAGSLLVYWHADDKPSVAFKASMGFQRLNYLAAALVALHGAAYVHMDKRAAGFIVAFLLPLLSSAALQLAGARRIGANRRAAASPPGSVRSQSGADVPVTTTRGGEIVDAR